MVKLIHGDNNYASRERLMQLAGENFTVLDGEEMTNLDAIVMQTNNFSLFSQAVPKVIVLKRFLRCAPKILQEKFSELLGTSLSQAEIILWEDRSADKREKLFKLLSKNKQVEEFTLPKAHELRKWLQQKAKEKGIVLDSYKTELLLQKAGTDQFLLESEITKLALLLKQEGRSEISIDDLAVVSASNQEGNIWALLDALSARDKVRVLREVNELLREQRDAIMIIAMLAKHFKLLFLLNNGVANAELTGKLKFHPFTISKAASKARMFDVQLIKALYNKLTNLDFAIKQGKIDAHLGLSMFLAAI